ncbi:mitochondrial zinc maintenance protein 1, mitochondrial [Lasiosphaeria miniovina]|uniref:Mitochondrial zinc maintenance protein 1, mitochondrial n=1 Tax=Lasiosphaeria miniovina TaxID=1954250 RepID=A0AA40BGZ1_9PEZI|nr:mitochondrial zinc maintenance protein 1, mitochondrial [Lasiosphaeria miniovina]KAK0733793.1 mitochondrial zinc maintenance protein 1, mitochondrial [Lasiosphaeria miniovina]
MALQAYRHLMRAARVAFEGDTRVLSAARQQIRDSFRETAGIDSPDVKARVQQAEEIASALRHNVVQGKKDGDRYKLRIHKDTERGDNDTIKIDGKTVTIDGKKCSDR